MALLALESVRETAEETASGALVAGGGVLAGAADWLRTSGSPVACSSTAHVINGTHLVLALAGSLAGKLLIKREDGALRSVVNVASSTTTSGKLGAGLRESATKERGRATSGRGVSSLWGLEGVACSSATRVHVGAGVWVRLGDLVGRHVVGGCVC